MADRVSELASPPYGVSSKSVSNSIGNVSHSSHGKKKKLMQRGFSVTDSSYSTPSSSLTNPNLVPPFNAVSTANSTISSATHGHAKSITSKHRKSHLGSGKLAGFLRAPFERTWSVPDHYSATNPSSPVSKSSSKSSIEKILSKEESIALLNQQRQKQPMQFYPKPHPVVIEAPIEFQEPKDYGTKHSTFHPLSSYHYYHPNEKQEQEPVYLDDPLIDVSSFPPSTIHSSHPSIPPPYNNATQKISTKSFSSITSPTTSRVAGNIYTNPNHSTTSHKNFQNSCTGTPIEVKLANIGSPVNFSPFVTTTGSLGGLANSEGLTFCGKNSSDVPSFIARAKAAEQRSGYCSTQPNSPTSTRQKIFPFFGRMRRFPSLKLQRHTTSHNKANLYQPLLINHTSSNKSHVTDDLQNDNSHIENNNNENETNIKNSNNDSINVNNKDDDTQYRSKQKPESYIKPDLHPMPHKRSPLGPTITVTTLSEDELNKCKPPTINHLSPPKSEAYYFDHQFKDNPCLCGTPPGHGSPPPQPSGDNFKFTSNTNVNHIHNPTSTSVYLRDQIISFFQPSDNKLAMKLFGNKNALMKEKMRQKAAGNWVIHPCSNFRFYWDLFMLVLLIANLIILPVAISFFNDDFSTKWVVFNGLSDTVFLLDLIINFRTGIIADNFADDIILEPREIAKHYLRTWFFLDLISSIPFDNVILLFSPDANITQLIHAGRALRIVRLVKLLSLLRLLRLSRLVRYVSQWEEDIGQFLTVASKFMRIVNLVCLILLLGHWNGCLQWLVPMIQEFPRDSWAALEELQNAHWTEQYTWALFKALSHMLCIGYGRYPPQSTTDVWLTTVSMLTGATCYALFVGHSTTLIQSFDTSRRLYREKFKQVEEYMIYRKLPRKLRQKITDYYEHRYQGKMFDEQSILAEVNECLREEIINFNCRALVASVPFFTHADPNFVSDIVTNLRHEMFQPGDYIIREGSVGTKVYFIQEGIVDIITQNGEVATSLSDGSYFGEICLLAKTKRTASVRAEAYCNLFSLSVEHFDSVLERYPLMRRTMESVAAERLNKIGKDPCILSNRDDLEADISMVNELIMRATPLPSSGSDDSDGHATDDDRKPQKKRKKKDDQASNGGGSSKDKEHTLTVKLATMIRRSRSNLNMMKQPSKDEKS